ncbi:hypothetical protein PG993_005503 [Apiospora rasikravindrae]|uniref:Ankyrin n=1 Tax=Apiospora rasikravindrae TaxID=990691 RepID=A0ABR1TFT4_9PEZI
MSSAMIPKPVEASHDGQISRKRVHLPPEVHQMIFDAINRPDRARTALSVMLANKELHGLWKRFLYEDNINNDKSSAMVHAVLYGHMQPMRDLVGVGTTAEGKSVDMNVYLDGFETREWCFDPTTICGEFIRYNQLTILQAAIARSDEQTVRFLVQNGADVNMKGYAKEYNVDPDAEKSPEEGYEEYYDTEETSESNLYDDLYPSHECSFQSPIHMATCQGHLPIVQILVDAKSTLLWNPTQVEGFSVLHTAAMCGHAHLIRYFVKNGLIPVDSTAPCFTKNHPHRLPMMLTPAQCAAHTKAGIRTLWLFKELGADMSLVVLPLLRPSTLRASPNFSLARQLLTEASWKVDLGANVLEFSDGKCSLADAILDLYLCQDEVGLDVRGWRLILQIALAGGADINRLYRQTTVSPDRSLLETLFNYTTGKKASMLTELLLRRGAQNLTHSGHDNFETYGNSLLLMYLNDSLLNHDKQWGNLGIWSQGLTARDNLVREASDDSGRKIKALLAAGIRVDGVNEHGFTSLIMACLLVVCCDKPMEFMKMLLDAGADPNQTSQLTSPRSNGKLKSPMAVCFSNMHCYWACKLLHQYGGTLHKDDDLNEIEGRINQCFPFGKSRVMELFKKLANQVKSN